jgi:hypothetical protein
VAKVGTPKAGGTISQARLRYICGLPRTPIKGEEEAEEEEEEEEEEEPGRAKF